MNKNSFSLTKRSAKNGYDWWWHSFVAMHAETGELKPFFIEYYVINPGLWAGEIVFGQLPESIKTKRKPCYAMLKVGTWGNGKVQLHNFYPINDFCASKTSLDCRIGSNTLTESHLSGSVYVSQQECAAHPEWMCDSGSMSWDLNISKRVQFDVGFGSSRWMNLLDAFTMYWHVEGMKCELEGEVLFNNERYIVKPEISYGYQDKNWGSEYTNPWIWLNCNNFHSKISGEKVDASLDLGGGCPMVFGISLNRRILTAFFYKNEFIEFNFSKFWKKSQQQFDTHEDDTYFYWDVLAENRNAKIEVHFKCAKTHMLLVNYESPNGTKKHNKLWNGGHAEGTVAFYKKENKTFILVDELEGSFGGCEFGMY